MGNEKRRWRKEKRRKRLDWFEEMTAREGRMWEGEEKQRKKETEGRRRREKKIMTGWRWGRGLEQRR